MFSGGFSPIFVAVAAAVVISLAALAIIMPLLSPDRGKEKRISSVMGKGPRAASIATTEAATARRKSVADSISELENRQKAKQTLSLKTQLERAGLEAQPRDFYIMSALGGVMAAAVCFFFVSQNPIIILCVLMIFGLGLPRLVLRKMITRYQAKFLKELVGAIDVIVRGIKTGLPLNECLQIVARECPEPVASEFKEIVDQQRLGVTLPDCLERMSDRVPLAEVRFLTIVIAIQQSSGGNLSEALANLGSVLRDRFSLRLKIKALSAEAKASAYVLGSLPFVVMLLVNISAPDYMVPMFTTTVGNFLLLGCGVLMMIGILIMRKMINFKF